MSRGEGRSGRAQAHLPRVSEAPAASPRTIGELARRTAERSIGCSHMYVCESDVR